VGAVVLWVAYSLSQVVSANRERGYFSHYSGIRFFSLQQAEITDIIVLPRDILLACYSQFSWLPRGDDA